MSTFEKIFLAYCAILAVFLTVSASSPLQLIFLPLPVYFGYIVFSQFKNLRKRGPSKSRGPTLLDKKGLFVSFVVFLVLLSIGFANVKKPQAETKGLSIVAEETPAPPEQEAPISKEPQNEIIEVKVKGDGFVNIREAPNTTAAKLGTANDGQQYPLVGTQDDWYEILFDGTHAFINKEFAAPPKEQK